MRSGIVLAGLVLAPSLAIAQDLTISGEVTLATRYMSLGLEQTEGAAVQPYLEIGLNGFYVGLWASNVSRSIIGNTNEVDVYVGYRNEVGAFSYDVGYGRYFYTGPYLNCCGEFYASLGLAASERVGLGLYVAYDPDAEATNTELSVDFAASDRIGLSALVGNQSNSHDYWQVGADYALRDDLSINLSYHDSEISDGIAVLAVTYGFSIR